ncbi:MAG: lytic transglycosylase domain-containing protein [Puia sp.]|nr:lytic transglycosylase domain-containing protein [Puia sp.]
MPKETFLIRSLPVSLCFLLITPFPVHLETGGKENRVSQENHYYFSSMTAIEKTSLNKHAKQFVKTYIRQNRTELYSIRQRSRQPFSTIDSIFRKYKLPLQLKYLAVIESELKTRAVSRVGAAGPWQLMPQTAQILGLKITNTRDERTQYDKSTKAAALYLRDLYSEFGDWLLVLAAYNSGPGPVYQAIRQSGSRNFWALQSYLPAETRGHVKKFIAAHYYFEGCGSETTLTKMERMAQEAASGRSYCKNDYFSSIVISL